MPISTRVISHQEEERGLPGGLALPVVVCEFRKWEVFRPVVLLMVNEKPEVGLYPLIVSLRLSVGSRMVRSGDVLLYGEESTQLLREPRRESRVSVADYLGG
jgi:hypothetical protein